MLDGLASLWPDKITSFGLQPTEPLLEDRGALRAPDTLSHLLAEERVRLQGPGRYNETQLVLADDTWRVGRNPCVIPVQAAEYALISALRRAGQPPCVVSASVLLCSWEARCLVVQRRSSYCDLDPGTLHPVSGSQRAGEGSLLETARRELREETGLCLSLDRVPALLMHERFSHSLQYVLLGANVSAGDVGGLRGSIEGDLVAVPFDELEDSLTTRSAAWAETGWYHVLAWLLTLPPSAPACFGGRPGPELAAAVLAAA